MVYRDPHKYSSTRKNFPPNNNTNRPIGANVKVTDILVRGGGGTITFSDGVTVEYVFGFRPDSSVPSGGIFDVTLQGERAQLVYQNVVSQAVCDMVDWLLQCSSLNSRVSIIEAKMGIAKEFAFGIPDWALGTPNAIEIIREGLPGVGQIGPHEFPLDRAYSVSVFRDDGTPIIVGVDTDVEINLLTGLIRLKKTGLSTPFAGRVIIGSVNYV